MTISSLDILVIAAYMLVVLGIGVYQAVKIKSTGDYYAGGRKFGKFYMMMNALSQASDADEPVSVMGAGFQKGLSGIWYTYLYLPLTPIFWLIAPYIRRTRFVTTADFFSYRFDRSLSFLYAVTGVLKMSIGIGIVLKSTSTIFNSMSGGTIHEGWAILVMTVVFIIYGFAGGLRATVVTEGIQGPLIVAMSMLLLPFGFAAVGGFRGLHQALGSEMFSLTLPHDPTRPGEFTPTWIIVMSVTALIGFVAQPGIVALFGSGKSEMEGRVGYTYGTMIKRLCAIGWVFTGVLLAAMVVQRKIVDAEISRLAENRELAFGSAMRALLPMGLVGLMFAAIFASQMAALSARMVNASALASRNLYRDFLRPGASDREVLWIGRVSGLFLVAIGVYLARDLRSVADALTMLLQFSAIMGVVVWAGILWRRTNVPGAWAAIITTFVPWFLLGPPGTLMRKHFPSLPQWIGMYGTRETVAQLMASYLPAGVVALVVVSLLTRRQADRQADNLAMLLRTPVGDEQKLIDAGVPIIYAGSTVPNALEIKHPKLVHWGGFLLAVLLCVLILGLLKLLATIGA